ncbi:MAG TPA: hypothetical protein VGO63_03710 [Candidatus Paceibacterota bacterium]|jgi:hypothetical protein|nr:hypothetical protein [Candidatus Paceibacterota bacterium]
MPQEGIPTGQYQFKNVDDIISGLHRLASNNMDGPEENNLIEALKNLSSREMELVTSELSGDELAIFNKHRTGSTKKRA